VTPSQKPASRIGGSSRAVVGSVRLIVDLLL
jgi:hypothetical protein